MNLKPAPKPGWEAPTQEALEAQALDYLKKCKPREYRELKKTGELQELCRLRADAARNYAESLIHQGMWEREAWPMAIRLEILESESD